MFGGSSGSREGTRVLKPGLWPVLISPRLGAQMVGAGVVVEGANCPGD